jgi:predicted DsbA family dithiol-disulfide isomerase
MTRPDFPNPYCVLTSEIIDKVVSGQGHYDSMSEQERAFEEQREQVERDRLEAEAEAEDYQAWKEQVEWEHTQQEEFEHQEDYDAHKEETK